MKYRRKKEPNVFLGRAYSIFVIAVAVIYIYGLFFGDYKQPLICALPLSIGAIFVVAAKVVSWWRGAISKIILKSQKVRQSRKRTRRTSQTGRLLALTAFQQQSFYKCF
jgi:K+-transporting ATPase A subunit